MAVTVCCKYAVIISIFDCLWRPKTRSFYFYAYFSLHRKVHVSLPGETRANGTLFAVVYVHKAGVSPLEDSREVHYAVQLTTYITPLRTDVQKDKEKVHHHSELHHISPSILPLHIFYIMWHFYGAQLPCTVHYLFIFWFHPEAEIWEPCIPLETPPVTHCHVRGLHLHKGWASQWRAPLHESVSQMKLWRSKPGELSACCWLLLFCCCSGTERLRGTDTSDRKSNTLWCFCCRCCVIIQRAQYILKNI